MQYHFSKTEKESILSKPIPDDNPKINESFFSFLFSEFISYEKRRVSNSTELEQKMDKAGFEIGFKMLEYLYSKIKPGKRPVRLLDVLQFLGSHCWKALFGKGIDSLERGAENDNEYILTDYQPLCSKYISVPKELGEFSCCSYVGGIIRGVMSSAGFPCHVTAYDMKDDGKDGYAVYLISLDKN